MPVWLASSGRGARSDLRYTAVLSSQAALLLQQFSLPAVLIVRPPPQAAGPPPSPQPPPPSPPPPSTSLTSSELRCADERQVCIDLGPGLWVEQNSGNTQQTNTAEFDYRTSNNGFTVVYNGNQLATVVIPSDTPGTTGVLWPQLLPQFNNACSCCDLCRAQPNEQVSPGLEASARLIRSGALGRLAGCNAGVLGSLKPGPLVQRLCTRHGIPAVTQPAHAATARPCSRRTPQRSARSGATGPLMEPAACSSTPRAPTRRPSH